MESLGSLVLRGSSSPSSPTAAGLSILLYSKVGHEAAIQEAARLWLFCPATAGLASYRTVAELYLLCVLLPLGHTEDARQLVLGEVGGRAFSEDQRRLALEVVAEKEEAESRETPPDDGRHSPSPGVPVPTSPSGGALRDKLQAMLRLLWRSLSPSGGSGWSPLLRRLVMAVVLVYLLVVQMNPALPSSYLWINKLLQLLKQMWNVMFKPHYSA
ncbi:hypothetical protein CRUP_017738 [Coryphaenoides rupestris]|nr:hypothetical protein CRUP_017738 [Coryphaenoides rupestris]